VESKGRNRVRARPYRFTSAIMMALLASGCGGGVAGTPPTPSIPVEVVEGVTGSDGRLSINLRLPDARVDLTVQDQTGRSLAGIRVRAVADRSRIVLLAWDPLRSYMPEVWSTTVSPTGAGVRPKAVSLLAVLSLVAAGFGVYDLFLDNDTPDAFLDVGGGRLCAGFSGDIGDFLSATSIVGAGIHILTILKAIGPFASGVKISFATLDTAGIIGFLSGYTERRTAFGYCFNSHLVINGKPAFSVIRPLEFFYASSGEGHSSGPSRLFAVGRSWPGSDLMIGTFQTPAGIRPPITDLAGRADGGIFGISFSTLYNVDPRNARMDSGRPLSVDGANSAALDPVGNLFVGTTAGELYRVDPGSGAGSHVMTLPEGLRFHGDLVFEGQNVFVATTASPGGQESILVRGNVSSRTATRVGGTSFSNVWGLGLFGGNLYGVSANPATGRGLLLSIDRATGRGSRIRDIDFSAFGGTRRP